MNWAGTWYTLPYTSISRRSSVRSECRKSGSMTYGTRMSSAGQIRFYKSRNPKLPISITRGFSFCHASKGTAAPAKVATTGIISLMVTLCWFLRKLIPAVVILKYCTPSASYDAIYPPLINPDM